MVLSKVVQLLFSLVYGLLCASVMAATTNQDSLYSQLQGDVGIDLLLNVIAACGGGIANTCFKLKTNKEIVINWYKTMLLDLIVSGFVGAIVFMITESYNVDNFWQIAQVGTAGWLGGLVMETVAGKFHFLNNSEKPHNKRLEK